MTHSTPTEATISLYVARTKIHPRDVTGRYATLRWVFLWVTQLVYYGVPWLQWNERQAVLFDIAARKFYLFGIVLWPQDFIFLAALLILCAFLLFLATAVAGRVWCGFSCPQTVYTKLFLWIERCIEGDRSARIRLDREGRSLHKWVRRGAKHIAWLLVALWTSITFVGYFTPISELVARFASLALGPWEMFWVGFYALATYGNAGWLREQVCRYMCPYARFQSAMLDSDTLIISYDARRGEPRHAYRRQDAGTTGDCIDCTLCVQVCPAGIDIRNGLQQDCIGCAACIDACNGVMQKVHRPSGLIRYTSENALQNGWDAARVRAAVLRPRVLIYAGLLALLTLTFAAALLTRAPLKLDVIRDRGVMSREVADGWIENVYRLQMMNTTERITRYRISVSGMETIRLGSADVVEISPLEVRSAPLKVRVQQDHGSTGSHPIRIRLTSMNADRSVIEEEAVFFLPKH